MKKWVSKDIYRILQNTINKANHELSVKLEKAKMELAAAMKAKVNSEIKLSDKEFEHEFLKKELAKIKTEKENH